MIIDLKLESGGTVFQKHVQIVVDPGMVPGVDVFIGSDDYVKIENAVAAFARDLAHDSGDSPVTVTPILGNKETPFPEGDIPQWRSGEVFGCTTEEGAKILWELVHGVEIDAESQLKPWSSMDDQINEFVNDELAMVSTTQDGVEKQFRVRGTLKPGDNDVWRLNIGSYSWVSFRTSEVLEIVFTGERYTLVMNAGFLGI